MKKTNLIFLISTAIFFTSTLVLIYLNYLKPQSTTSIPTTRITPTEISDSISDWKTYNSSDFGFSINYPQDLLIQNFINDQYNRTVSFKGSDIYFSISLRKADPNFNLDKYYFMDSPIARTTTLSSQKANVYEMPKGYCDGPGCSQPYISIVTEHNNDVYSLSFFGDSNLSSVESQILSTFKFTDKKNEGLPISISAIFSAIKPNLITYSNPKLVEDEWQLDINSYEPKLTSIGSLLTSQFNMVLIDEVGSGKGGQDTYENDKVICYLVWGNNVDGGPETWVETNSFAYLSCAEK